MTAVARSREIVRRHVVASTQTVAFELAERGAADRTVLVADFQTEGRGRVGRVWHAESGSSLLCSILIRPRLSPALLPTLSLTTAVAVSEALHALASVDARLKWPNDVLIDGKKAVGILLESRTAGPRTVVVIGLGVNLLQREFPEALGARATSLLIESGIALDRDRVLDRVLERFDVWRGRLERDGFEPVRRRWLALADTIGRRVTVDGVDGVAVDLDGRGALIVDDGHGSRRVVSGEVAVVDRSAEDVDHAAGR